MLIASRKTLNRLASDERGAVAMIFALSMFAVVMMLGCAIDYGRALMVRTKLATAVDAATIFAAKRIKDGATLASIEADARTLFDQNMLSLKKMATVTEFHMNKTPDGLGIKLDAKAEMPTTFARIARINKMDIGGTATAIFNQQDIEVGLQLDVTGSMDQSIKGKKKIDSLKVASNNLLDILLPAGGTGTTKVRVGIAPFAAGVNAGGYANAVVGGSAPGNCVYERRTSFADATDDAPNGSDTLKKITDLGRGAQSCPSGAKIAALTDNKSSLVSTVNALSAGGSTAGHLGTSWAWYLLSPNWSSIWPTASQPSAYNDGKTLKFAILMTDGIYNTVGGVSGGDYSTQATDAQTRAKSLCDNMKAKGITIYSVGFIAAGDPPAAADTLKYCASDASSFYKAEDGDQLNAAFANIAKDISRLRLSK
jgi:Flp pilus assembly protein TadG